MKIKPLSDRVVIKPLEEMEVKKGSIIIPDTAKERPMQGEVVEAGPGKTEDGKKVPPVFKDEIASGIGGSKAKLQHVKHQKFDQPAPSN